MSIVGGGEGRTDGMEDGDSIDASVYDTSRGADGNDRTHGSG